MGPVPSTSLPWESRNPSPRIFGESLSGHEPACRTGVETASQRTSARSVSHCATSAC
jgi:hypothetical protein